MKIGIYGEEGSFSHEAASKYAKENNVEAELVHLVEMDPLLTALKNGEIEVAILPVVNQNGGLVRRAFEAMGQYEFTYENELKLPVVQCLITLPETKREEVTQIASHPQAHRQCAVYLEKAFPNAELVEWNDTASAARDLANGVLPKTSAVLASAKAAELYDLNLMEEGVEDNPENVTTFVILKPL